MSHIGKIGMAIASIIGISMIGCSSSNSSTSSEPRVVAASPIAAGKYLVMIGGCNECHTPGYEVQGMNLPEDQWLIGVPVGFRGPWGTTYATNLRRFMSSQTEDLFVQIMKARKARPPMPWESMHAMSEPDLRAVFQYIKSLPVRGDVSPEFVPAGVEPKTPYILFEPVAPKG